MDPADLRAHIGGLCLAGVPGCFAKRPEGDETPPIVVCARHKALAIDAALDVLAAHEEACLEELQCQLEAVRGGVVAASIASHMCSERLSKALEDVRAAAAVKRAALQTEAVAVDAVLEGAIAAVAALAEVRMAIPRE